MKETEKRKRFFKVAVQLIAEKGFKAMSLRMLATELACDVSNIYNYVKNKNDILEQLLFEISGKFHEEMATIEASSDSPLEKLRRVISLHVQLTVEHPYQVNLLANEWRHLKPEKQQAFIEFRNAYEQKLKSILQEGIEKGELRSDNLEFTANCFLSAIRWLYSWYTPEKKEIPPAELERLMIDFVLRGIER